MEKSPLFIKIDEYNQILGVVDKIKERVSSVHKTLSEIKQLRVEEEEAISDYESGVAQIEKRLLDVDKLIFEPEQ